MSLAFQDRRVIVTGAGGSIGSRLCHEVLEQGAEELVLVSLTEAGLYDVDRRLRAAFPDTETTLVPVLGSAGNPAVMEPLFRRHPVDIVIHAAAHKHVPICEANPCSAIENNVGVTVALMAMAAAHGVDQFCLVSSDKAVRPASVMGATKRLAERALARLQGTPSERGSTTYCTVRFGNVLDSAGSVLPLWREQIAAGGPITLTDARCERFFMSIPDAVSLIAAAIALEQPGLYVFDMGPPRKLIDLAEQLVAAAKRPCEIRLTGLRPGEKLTEELHHGGNVTGTGVPRVLQVVERDVSPLDPGLLSACLHAAGRHHRQEALDLLWRLVR
jgi:FlaA1/EpsC-like NDP-sugar epimerase